MISKKINQKGFTLIELLVTIALMLSILGIAIVSFITVSNNKKEESWDLVKQQVETAATEYFNANEYLFEDFSKPEGYISVGKLVSENYLNVVVDPTTGNAVDTCSLVVVTRNGNKLNATFDNNKVDKKNCDFNGSVITKESGAPEGVVKYYDKNNKEVSNDGWFNISKLDENGTLKVCLTAADAKSGTIKSAKIGDFAVSKTTDMGYCTTITKDDIYSNVLLQLENTSDKKWQKVVNIYKDTVKPTGTIVINKKDKWASKNVKLNLTGKDDVSGIAKSNVSRKVNNKNEINNYFNGNSGAKTWSRNNISYQFSEVNSYKGDTKSLTLKITDVAGNVSDDINGSYKLYTSCQNKNITDNGKWQDTKTRKKCTGTGTSTSGGKLSVQQKKATKDVNSGAKCADATRTVEYNVPGCCNKIVKDGATTNNKYNNYCNNDGKRYGTGTQKYKSALNGSHCGSKPVTISKSCDLDLKCRIEKTTKGCKSSADNQIYGQIKVICNQKVASVKVTYTYDTNSSYCKKNSTNTYKPGNKNAAVFNFRGCGGSYKLKEAKFEVKQGNKSWSRKVTNWSTGVSSSSGNCNPDRGSASIKY